MRNKVLVLIILFAFTGLSLAQSDTTKVEPVEADNAQNKKLISIVGQIKDANTGEILSGVKIMNEKRNHGDLSKQNGFYTIVAAVGDIIRFSHVGYEPIYMRINADAGSKETVMVTMEPNDLYIEEVVVGQLPSLDELDEAFMALDVEDDKSRELAEQNPDTFNILDEIDEPGPGGPVSFLKEKVFDKIKEKKKKKGKKKSLPKFKD